MERPRTAILLLVFLTFKARLVFSASRVDFLPGFQGPLPFQLETGYVGVGESENDQLFYYFVKSEGNPETDPLMIWLTGGPYCSALTGLLDAGPLNFKIEPYNGSLPQLVLNPYSWTKKSSIIFVDSPVGTGFSYSKTPSPSPSGDLKQARDLLRFFKRWLLDHSEFISNPIYIAGDSYSGIIIPVFVQEISNGIEEGILPRINLQGYIIGNPVTIPSDGNYKIPFAHGMALISNELYKALEKSCGGEYQNVDPSNTECLKYLQDFEECISKIEVANILDPKCPVASPKPRYEISSERRRWLNDVSDLIHSDSPHFTPNCRNYDQFLARFWANDPSVRIALHVIKGSIEDWQRCNTNLTVTIYRIDVHNSVPYHQSLSKKGYRSLIYSGDHDMMVPFLATQAWIRSLNYSIIDEWRPWIVQDQVAGYTRSYSNNMTFATVKAGGHTSPQYKPKECFAMFKRWIDSEPL